MKYFILINQQVLSETELDIIDGAILDYIYFYCSSQNEKIKKQRIIDKNEIWTWIDYSTLLADMPMLKLKSRGILTLRINKIEQAGYIKTKRFQHMKKYFQITAKFDELSIQMNRAIHSDKQGYSPDRIAPIQSREPIKIKNNKDIDKKENLFNKSRVSPQKQNNTNNKKNVSKADTLSEKSLIHKQVVSLFDFYKALFIKRISSTPPIFDWAICERNAKPFIKQFGLERTKRFVNYYLSSPKNKSDREKFENCSWSLRCFLTADTFHRISIKVK